MAVRRLGELTRTQVADLVSDGGPVVVLPIGSVEQHGPDLPLCTDIAMAEAVVEQACTRLRDPERFVLAPGLPYGNSMHHLFACAASLRSETLLRVLADLIDSLYTSGFRRLFFVNGHGGNDECMRLAIKDAALRNDMVLGACSYWTLSDVDAPVVPGHAGDFEASLLLAARPDLAAEEFASRTPGPRAVHTESFGPGVTVVRAGDWRRSGGFTDDPGEATADAGRQRLDQIAQRLAEALERAAEVPLPS
ncbi:creatininase family protein [Saccharopolyspora sp. K220]|uniref:creatininase family protein n=1 Tax=Saccharopolyspora soli TaxID=2926618 RepID=UPI001F56E531|nr:creatininase family protein [Saccharopolyspora soli]MCI2416329.1 creatininase family protein [Saccharopolyspora soli]